MDLLKKELERKKKALKSAAEAAGTRRFIPAGKLRRLQEQQEEERIESTRSEKRQRTEDTVASEIPAEIIKGKKEVETLTKKDGEETNSEDSSISTQALTLQLRDLGLPVRLFGEEDAARRQRLQQAEKDQKESLATRSEKEEFRLGKGHGIRNPFLEQDVKGTRKPEKVAEVTTSEPNESEKAAAKKEAAEDATDPHKRIYRYFKDLLRQWEDDLTRRPDDVKRSVSGRNETKTLKQCKDYIRPLFKLCKSRKLEESLMANILKIIDFCQKGDFVKAHDAYLDVAIGRAAWPIGVTMVGIHARTGRSKIESQNVAHVMNSELQRKYLTSVKRLMTYAQKKRKDVDPSMKVMN